MTDLEKVSLELVGSERIMAKASNKADDIGLCRQFNMLSDAIVSIDGSKFKASNTKANNYTPKKVPSEIDRVEKHINQFLTQLDKSNNKEKESDITPIEEKIT